ncbi:glycosyltransferase family 2 protein [Poseidonocella sp. HB161398]|uniref:glycosyltransferase family 2 protein n=1 Tax=Poseidonocella sp. HB161398 TaxID=2320855 RepID=UPI0014862FA3|nr:glycosyltransferase [Poseidonocella sp. HB161398]
MTSTFQHLVYADENPDVAEHFGRDSSEDLHSHFNRHGRSEMRGMQFGDFMRLEAVMLSDQGDVYLAGWADRRVIDNFRVSIEIGYMRHELGEPEFYWYHRSDVAEVIGDTECPSGFICVAKAQSVIPHSKLRVYVGGYLVYQENALRLKSPSKFLNEALGACAVLADRPIGSTLPQAQGLYPAFAGVWRRVLDKMTFLNAFSHQKMEKAKQSVIITIYRRADMLLIQLSALAKELIETGTEVIVVGNDLQGADMLIEQLGAFCQIHPIDLSVWLCSGNSGFSAGNNFGASKARGEILVFMNPDIFPHEHDDGSTAKNFFAKDPGNALHGALLYYGDGLLMHSGMYTTSDVVIDAASGYRNEVLRVEHFGKGLSHHIDDLDTSAVLQAVHDRKILVSAALWKIRNSVFQKVGGLPEDYIFAYYEDADFCLQLLNGGYDIVLDSTSRWLHMEGVGKEMAPAVRSFMWLNRAHYTQRYCNDKLVVDAETDLTLI